MINVLIPVYNQIELTKQVIKQCEKLWTPYIITVFNNWSTDWTDERLVQEWIDHSNYYSNIFVNPSWNILVEETKYPYILVINNDILITQDLGKHLIEQHEWWITCPRIDNGRWPEIYETNINGTCFFMETKDWTPIPETLKLWYWDDYLFRKHKVKWIEDTVYHLWSQTLSRTPWVQEIIDKDTEEWKLILKQNNWYDSRFN